MPGWYAACKTSDPDSEMEDDLHDDDGDGDDDSDSDSDIDEDAIAAQVDEMVRPILYIHTYCGKERGTGGGGILHWLGAQYAHSCLSLAFALAHIIVFLVLQFDVSFGSVVEVEQISGRPMDVDSDEGDEDDNGEDEEDDEDRDRGDGNGVHAENEAELDAAAELEEEQALVEEITVEEITDSAVVDVDDPFSIPRGFVRLPRRHRLDFGAGEMTSDDRVPAELMDTFVRIARLGETGLSEILGMRQRRDEEVSDDDDGQPTERRAVVLAFTHDGGFRALGGARRPASHSDSAHPLMRFDTDSGASSSSETGAHAFDDVSDEDDEHGESENMWRGFLEAHDIGGRGDDDDETIATRLSRIPSASAPRTDDASSGGLASQLHQRRLDTQRRLATENKVKAAENMWINFGFPHWVDSSDRFITYNAPALQEQLFAKIPVVHDSGTRDSEKKSKTASDFKKSAEGRPIARSVSVVPPVVRADLLPRHATVVATPVASGDVSGITVVQSLLPSALTTTPATSAATATTTASTTTVAPLAATAGSTGAAAAAYTTASSTTATEATATATTLATASNTANAATLSRHERRQQNVSAHPFIVFA